jgi:DnaJ domain/LppP/LprE lipoprotein
VEDLYRVLQVRRGADQETIAAAFARLSRRYDPAFGGPFADEEKMREIAGAYAVLSDESVRRDYDNDLQSGRTGKARPSKTPKYTRRPAPATRGSGSPDPWRRPEPSDKPSHGRATKGPVKPPGDASPPSSRRTDAPAMKIASTSGIWRNEGSPPKTTSSSPFVGELPATQPLPVFNSRPAQTGSSEPEPPATRSEEAGHAPGLPADPTDNTVKSAEENPLPGTPPDVARTDATPATPLTVERTSVETESERPPRRRRPGAIAAAAVALIAAGAALAVWGSFQAFGRADDSTSTSEAENAAESAAPTAAPGQETAAPAEPVPPATISSAVALPEEFATLAEERVSGEGYTLVGVVATNDATGAYFYAALGEDDDGSGQRVFFFSGSEYLGTDWGIDVRGIETLTSSGDGQISAIYRAYAADDEVCCPSLDPIVVFFTYEGGFRSSNADPPPEIFVS